ncbi:Chromatin modification-related MEAF6 [Chlorella sorokiniana]|uniref:Chromatin modification-related MEAF6 n=1 Tax=Chlorella sorokiniana TaxID=3076 RepID=A0A2P6TNI8_CHLSO|nr:Chromatin modification-related MEAF6 [Chlorella sorokiniana]|eukprot:PRW50892.1 Chromatin modification-related MEAF6 [Chlorella sorokiniana]
MTRPKAPKARQQGAAAGAQPAGEEAELQQQQQQQQQAAAKKRPEAAGGAAAAAAAAAGGGGGGSSEQVEVHQLERKRMQVADELRQVERQIYDLETNYFQVSSAMGNAIRGYEGFLGGSKTRAPPPVQPEERLFSWSSMTGQLGVGGGAAGVEG